MNDMSQDDMRILITAGRGPAECRLFAKHAAGIVRQELEDLGLDVCCINDANSNAETAGSWLLYASGLAAIHPPVGGWQAWQAACYGTWRWRCREVMRKGHKRANWFIAVQSLPSILPRALPRAPSQQHSLDPSALVFQALRAGGAGGQHQNTTDSAVRVTHKPSGLSLVVRDQRSQQANKKLAIQRLAQLLQDQAALQQSREDARLWRCKQEVERGNPVRCYEGLPLKLSA